MKDAVIIPGIQIEEFNKNELSGVIKRISAIPILRIVLNKLNKRFIHHLEKLMDRKTSKRSVRTSAPPKQKEYTSRAELTVKRYIIAPVIYNPPQIKVSIVEIAISLLKFSMCVSFLRMKKLIRADIKAGMKNIIIPSKTP
jgi:hypothetical protein